MASISTRYLPLTTTFTAPAQCTNGPWIYLNVPTTWWKAGGDNVPSCFPPAFPFSNSRIVYSPGICPGGWSSACERAITTSASTQTIISCCPSDFECASTSSDVHDWEDQFGCASSYSVDTAVWGISSGAAYVNSIYQLQVMIVEAASTSSSSVASSDSSMASSSLPASPSRPSTSATTSALSSATGSPISEPTSSEDLSAGAIAGVVVGAVVGLAIIAFLAYMAWAVRKRNRAPVTSPQPMAQPPDYSWNAQYNNNNGTYYHTTAPAELDPAGQLYELKAPS